MQSTKTPDHMDDEGRGQARWRGPALGIFGTGGLVLAVYLLNGAWPELVTLIRRAGMALAWVVPLRFAALGIDARGWWGLFPDRVKAPSWRRLTLLAIIRDGINNLLPVVRVGGEMAAVRLLRQSGIRMPMAAASIVVEISLTLVLLVVLTFAGVGGLLARIGAVPLVASILFAAVCAAIMVGVFLVVQLRVGLAGMAERLLARLVPAHMRLEPDTFARFDRDILAIYARTPALWGCAGWQLLGMAGGMVEMWWVLRLVHVTIGLGSLFILESLIVALQNLSFAVPAAIGIQEGGFVLLGSALGIGADAALLLALVRRARQVLTGVPALVLWRGLERQPRALALADPVPENRT